MPSSQQQHYSNMFKTLFIAVAAALIPQALAVCSSGQIAIGNTLPFEIQPVRFLDLIFRCKF